MKKLKSIRSYFPAKSRNVGQRKKCSYLTVVLLLLLLPRLSGAVPPVITYVQQPAAQNSTLIDKDKKPILDSVFATDIGNALINPITNQPRVDHAFFSFQQCFGGGFLDDLDSVLTGKLVNWAGGSASQHDEPSLGQVRPDEWLVPPKPAIDPLYISPVPHSLWTRELLPQLMSTTPTAEAIDIARLNDPVGSNPVVNPPPPAPQNGREHGQVLYRNGGGAVSLVQPAANKHHAILWAGYTDYWRHFHNVDDVLNRLVGAWTDKNYANYEVHILFGDGANAIIGDATTGPLPTHWTQAPAACQPNCKVTVMPATTASLKNLLQNLAVTAQDEFFFYASDHGGNSAVGGGGLVPGIGGPATIPITLNPGMMQGMDFQSDNVPTLTVDYSGLTGAADVFWNGALLGSLNSLQTTLEFPIPESSIQLTNTVSIENHSGLPFQINQTRFFTGAINDNPSSIPEPTSLLLVAALGSAVLTCSRRKPLGDRRDC
jgi:hypothetical protein